jgi:hypothetical protein
MQPAATSSLTLSSGDEASAGSNVDALGAAGGSSVTSSSNVPPGMREVRYWHEITRSHWVNRLGNLVLLQPSGQQVRGEMWCCYTVLFVAH